ncbi:S1C family serine protease [Enterococcus lemanii]|uniref:S1C family serine protease n=1 Tax=Enterococcus lemanii TaxID=1159752 RepID=A0ABV9MZB3_9ENTE|nr:trypsin-like peptidase domain-containing protein [Enterococcus lemanii]MBM7709884.1 serine protease Do [Enterococcus lemanii]
MSRKDVTPNQNNLFKKFGISLAGGILGGMLVLGGFYAFGTPNGNGSSGTTNTTTTQGGATVSNVKVGVTSDITQAVEKVQGAVVSVINLQGSQSNSLEDIFGSRNQKNTDDTLQAVSEGSGVIYKKEGNFAYIVTNNHVVDGQQGLEVMLKDGSKVEAELIGTDAFTDLAVLKIAADKVDTVATFGDSDALKVGEPAIAIGSPLGSQYANSVTQGIISSLNRPVQSTNDAGELVSINAIQTDAAINPGNSGGALVNIGGQVIGINSSKIASSSGSGVSVEGMGFAIPSNDVVAIIQQLEEKGQVVRPALGVSMIDLSNISVQQQRQILGLPESVTSGVVIRSVNGATPAEKAGLEQYDVITAIDGNPITSSMELRAALYKKAVGDTMEITFYRGDKEQTVTVELNVDQSILQQEEVQQLQPNQ